MKLFSFERRWLMTVFDATFSGGVATLPWKASELRTTQAFVTDVFRVGPPITMVGMRAAIWLVYLFTPLLAFALPVPTSSAPSKAPKSPSTRHPKPCR